MTADRQPRPEGAVSEIRGRWQALALRALVVVVLPVSLAGGFIGGPAGDALAAVAVAAVVTAPLLRVCWLLFRWVQERDRRFVILGVALIVVVASGAVSAAVGVGG